MSGNVVDPNFTHAMDNAAREAANMQSQSGDGQSVSLRVLTFWIPPKYERARRNTPRPRKVKDVYIYKVELRISLLDTTM